MNRDYSSFSNDSESQDSKCTSEYKQKNFEDGSESFEGNEKRESSYASFKDLGEDPLKEKNCTSRRKKKELYSNLTCEELEKLKQRPEYEGLKDMVIKATNEIMPVSTISHRQKEDYQVFSDDESDSVKNDGLKGAEYYTFKESTMSQVEKLDNDVIENKKPDSALKTSEVLETKNPKPEMVEDAKNESEIELYKSKIYAIDIAMDMLRTNDFIQIDDVLYHYCENDGYYEALSKSQENRKLRRCIPKEYERYITRNRLSELYECLLVNAPQVTVDHIKSRKYLNFLDCAVNMETDEVFTNRRSFYFTYVIRLNYYSRISTGYFNNFTEGLFEKKETLREFLKFLALSASDVRDTKQLFFLYGPGNTGKSVVLNLLREIVGEDKTAALSFTQFSNEFNLSLLHGKRLNLSGEVSGATSKRLDTLKSLSGNDTITASFKGQDPFAFRARTLLVFACNVFPSIDSVEEVDAFLNRLIVFPFRKVKERSEWIEDLEILLYEDEKSVVKAIVKGFKMLMEDNFQILESGEMEKIKGEVYVEYNSFIPFARSYLESEPEVFTATADIEREYGRFCQENECRRTASNVWARMMLQMFPCKRSTSEKDKGHRVRGYRGVKLNEHLLSKNDVKII